MFIKAGNKIVNIDRCESLEFRRFCRSNVTGEKWELIVEVLVNGKPLIGVNIAELKVDIHEFRPQWCDVELMYSGSVILNGYEDSRKRVDNAGNYREKLWTFFEEDTSRSESCFIEYVWNCIRDNINVDLINYECIGGQQ